MSGMELGRSRVGVPARISAGKIGEWARATWNFVWAALVWDPISRVPVVGDVLSVVGLSGVGFWMYTTVQTDHGTRWAIVTAVAYAGFLATTAGVRLQNERDHRGKIALRFTDYEYADVIAAGNQPNSVVFQGSFVVHNDGPDSDFEAWVPLGSIDWAGPGRLYGGFHLCWQLSNTLDERRRWIPRGSAERVDVVLIDSASRALRFLGPGRRPYMTLETPTFEVTGTIEIRDVKRDGARVPVTFKLTYRPDDGVATLRVPADSAAVYG